jgi:hypothetical protein
MPFLDNLEQRGFSITPNRLFQSLTAVGNKRVRFQQVPDEFWSKQTIAPAISNKDPLAYFAKYGIGPDKRSQQLIDGPVEEMNVENYSAWVVTRAQTLANAANSFVETLRVGVKASMVA